MKIPLLFAALILFGCSSKQDEPAPAAESQQSLIRLTAQDLDGFEKGLQEEIRLVKEGKERAARSSNGTERGNAIQSTFEENTIKNAVPISGLSFERYHQVRDVMGRLLTTLDFQDKIPGPQSVDTALADSSMKARLKSDPYNELDAPSAQLVKSRLDRIAPMWIEYTKLTIAGG
jgi:hypothetical protein